MSNYWHNNNCDVYNQLYNVPILMKRISRFAILVSIVLGTIATGCNHNRISTNQQNTSKISEVQENLINDGWYIPKSIPFGELSKEYGVKSKFGQQDNYFDIEIGSGFDVAIKIVNKANEQCIRYVFVPENTTANIQMILQGQYYLKLAYGKDWMEHDNGNGTVEGKFTSNVSYDKSVDVFDFGKKNSSSIISYVLQINIKDSCLQNNFETVSISEAEFMK